MRGIPHPHGLGFLLHGQNQCSDSTGLTSHLADGTVLQIQKPVTNNSLTNKMKNIKRNQVPYIPIAKARGLYGTREITREEVIKWEWEALLRMKI